jgi:enoyl-CoA hydratase/carnithine racemase
MNQPPTGPQPEPPPEAPVPLSPDLGSLATLAVSGRPGGVVLVTLAQPERRNAMTEEMTAEWGRVMAALRAASGVRAVVVTGEGSAFCSGGDISWIGAEPEASVDRLRDRMLTFYRTWLAVRDLDVPTVAAVNGPAVGAGLALAMACDLRYAAEDARLAVPFTALGMHPGMATTYLLREAVGAAVARDLLLTGRSVTGAEGVALGLVNGAVPAQEVLDRALGVAARIAAAAPVATRLTKRTLAADRPAGFAETLRREALAQAVTLATADLQEGLAAQRERRPPRFTGR